MGSISLDCNGSVGHPVRKDWSGHESLLDHIESGATLMGKIPRGTFVGKTCKQDSDVGVPINETMVEVGEPKERLNISNFLRFGPILNNLNFVGSHHKAFGRQHVSEVFTGSDVKFAFVCAGEKIICMKTAENFHNMLFMFG